MVLRTDGNCPHCGHDCNNEYIGVSARMINDKYYDTVKCSKCGGKFDRVYSMVLIGSSKSKSTKALLKEV